MPTEHLVLYRLWYCLVLLCSSCIYIWTCLVQCFLFNWVLKKFTSQYLSCVAIFFSCYSWSPLLIYKWKTQISVNIEVEMTYIARTLENVAAPVFFLQKIHYFWRINMYLVVFLNSLSNIGNDTRHAFKSYRTQTSNWTFCFLFFFGPLGLKLRYETKYGNQTIIMER